MCEQVKVEMMIYCATLSELEWRINEFCKDKIVQNIQYFSTDNRHCAMITYKIAIL